MPGYQERVVRERSQLSEMLVNLNKFIGSEAFLKVNEEEQKRLTKQSGIMTQYESVLTERINAFDLNSEK